MFLVCFSFTKNYHSVRFFFVITHQTVRLSIGGAKNIFDFEYDFECANRLLLLLNVTTCLHVSVVYALKHFERTYSLPRINDVHACWSTKLQAYLFNTAYILQFERVESLYRTQNIPFSFLWRFKVSRSNLWLGIRVSGWALADQCLSRDIFEKWLQTEIQQSSVMLTFFYSNV